MATREHGLFRKYETPPSDAAKGGSYIYYSAEAGVDTGVLIDFEGTLCLSNQEIRELAEVAGFSVNEEALALETELTHLQAENAHLKAVYAEAEALLEEIGRRAAQ